MISEGPRIYITPLSSKYNFTFSRLTPFLCNFYAHQSSLKLPVYPKHFFQQNIIYYIMSWEKIAADKRARIEASIPQEWRIKTKPTEDSVMNFPKASGIMSAEELAITESSATDLVALMAAGKLTSVAVTTAFCKRAALAHQLVYFTPFELPLYLLISGYSSIAPLSSSPRWH